MEIIFIIIACLVLGRVIDVVLGFFRPIGLGFIPDFALRMIFYGDKEDFNDNIIWNKPWLRFAALLLFMMLGGLLVHAILAPISIRIFSFPYMTLLVTVVYGYWIYRRDS